MSKIKCDAVPFNSMHIDQAGGVVTLARFKAISNQAGHQIRNSFICAQIGGY